MVFTTLLFIQIDAALKVILYGMKNETKPR